MQKLPVIFRRFKEGDVIALFPTLPAGPGFCVSYQHVGQHGGASRALVRSTRPARVEEPGVANLLAELTDIYTTRPGDNPAVYGEPVELVIRQRMPRA